jgi:hypothetical protein
MGLIKFQLAAGDTVILRLDQILAMMPESKTVYIIGRITALQIHITDFDRVLCAWEREMSNA